jgi:hypothetical protein
MGSRLRGNDDDTAEVDHAIGRQRINGRIDREMVRPTGFEPVAPRLGIIICGSAPVQGCSQNLKTKPRQRLVVTDCSPLFTRVVPQRMSVVCELGHQTPVCKLETVASRPPGQAKSDRVQIWQLAYDGDPRNPPGP